ncbi:MAG: GHKL domain-containing protein [Lachnospiraceae bacterium]|nr:GHKL domain-containing protein [Lachnospiraceae bacterium]
MFDFIISATTNFFRVYLIYRFSKVFFGRTVQEKNKAIIVCASFYIVNTALFWMYHTAWINIVCNLLGISEIVRLYTKSIKTNIFVSGTIYLINMGCDVAGTLLFIRYEDGQQFNQIYEIVSVFMILMCLLLAGKIVTIHKNVERTQSVSLILIPLCSIVIISILIYSNTCEEIGIAVVALGLLVINFFMLYLYNQLLHSISQKYETEMLKNQVRIYANQLDVIFQSEEKVKSLRHDMKHHMNELMLLANKYGAVEIQDYIDRMEGFVHNPKEIISSGNVEIDSVLNYMLQKAKEKLKTVTVKVMLPEEIKHSFDLNVLIGNLLENAIEAAIRTDKKYLNVYIALNRGVLKIQIDNSFLAENISKKEEEDGRKIFLTTKKRKEQHGIGLKNVKKIVESYNGNMNIQTKGDIFSVKLILYMSRIGNII